MTLTTVSGLPAPPAPGYRHTKQTRPIPDPATGAWSHTHRERLWIYDPAGNRDLTLPIPPEEMRWVQETAFDGLSPCCP